MKKFVCNVCGYEYDEDAGIPDQGIGMGTEWGNLPDGWICPVCGAKKEQFSEKPEVKPGKDHLAVDQKKYPERIEEIHQEFSSGEISTLCSSLAKACEKQYMDDAAESFLKLAEYYREQTPVPDGKKFSDLKNMLRDDLTDAYATASALASYQGDRGALRALVWGGKVSAVQSAVLERLEEEKRSMFKDKKIFVCEICGFISIGEKASETCPVCKVSGQKIHEYREVV